MSIKVSKDDTIIINGHDQAFSSIEYKFVIYLQYLEKEVWNGVHFMHADKHQSLYKLALWLLKEVARHVQGTQNMKLVIFLQ